ncbi:MAG: hypothetical protein OdinLCB4_007115 [Candidatus Odinarchaeum yellowstonii]|uniref:Uncharacterized protein n=1 Tax=Odinarchaeota yellowstonii (strain LCB_4) TaxID=1841599 RepID=A0AAF0D233_ODILC|nr:MAG: hypothetical protein OdinLCB4_007115 [Candidatus Odinarchaeum yellowstonii]
MLQLEHLIITIGFIASTPWIAAITVFCRVGCRKTDPLTKGYIAAAFFFASTIIIASLQALPLTPSVEAAVNLSYTLTYLGGVTAILHVLLKVYYPEKINQKILFTAALAALITKTYDYIDWAVIRVPFAEAVLTVSHILIAALTVSLIVLAVYAHIRVQTKILKTRLKLLTAAVIFLLAELLIIVVPGNPLYEYWWLTGAILIIPFSTLGAISVTYKYKNILKIISLESAEEFKPSRVEERIIAVLTKYTSRKFSCEYYDPALKSKCKLDPSTYRFEDCQGLKYRDGLICPKIVEYERKNGKKII